MQKRANSESPSLPHPSAILEGIEDAPRRICQAISFIAWKRCGDLVERQSQMMSLLPYFQVSEVFHGLMVSEYYDGVRPILGRQDQRMGTRRHSSINIRIASWVRSPVWTGCCFAGIYPS